MKKLFLLLLIISSIASCTNNPNIVQNYPESAKTQRRQNAGSLTEDNKGIIIFDGK